MNNNRYKNAMSGVRHSDELLERIFDMTVDKRKKNDNKHIIRIIAIVTMFTLIATATTVGAANYFIPDNSLNEMIELNSDVDYSTLGTEVNAVASYNGVEFKISKILCDNDIMAFPIKCPKYNGIYVKPLIDCFENDNYFEVYVNDKQQLLGVSEYDGATEFVSYKRDTEPYMCYITISGLRNIRNNSKIKIKFNRLSYFDNSSEEICDIKGDWEFNFTINRSNTRKELDINEITFDNGERCIPKKFSISPLGFRYEYIVKTAEPVTIENDLGIKLPNFKANNSYLFTKHIESSLSGRDIIIITMKDGTVYSNGDSNRTIESNCQFTSSTRFHNASGEINATFAKAIDIDNISKITILDKTLYKNQ